jgi:hypothetical protein
MKTKRYLLDSNVVIMIWREYPSMFTDIEKNQNVDFKISHDIAKELSQKEFKSHNGIPILSERFLCLLNHVLEEEIYVLEDKPNVNIKRNEIAGVYIINNNKLSGSDFNLICICNKHNEFTLVSEDKKIINSAKLFLDTDKVLNFHEFIEDLKKFL